MTARGRFILREACVGAVLNACLSYAIFWLAFGGVARVPVHGIGNFAFDFLPQAFAVGLMSAFVPGLFALAARRKGRFPGEPGDFTFLPRALFPRALVLGLAAMLFPALPVAGAVALLAGDSIGWGTASAIKMGFGSLVSLLVTPVALAAILPRG